MKKTLLIPVIVLLLLSCTNTVKETEKKDTKVALRADTVNVVKLTDTLIIYQSVCRGCAYEQSTHFEISDSLGVIQLTDVITKDNNPTDADGGSISKNLLLKAVKTGVTKIKIYKFNVERPSAEDSAIFTSYSIQVIDKN